jgi:hypothetical protein
MSLKLDSSGAYELAVAEAMELHFKDKKDKSEYIERRSRELRRKRI